MSRLWVLSTESLLTWHCSVGCWYITWGYFPVTKTPLDLLTFDISYEDHVPIKLVLHTDEIDPDKVVQDSTVEDAEVCFKSAKYLQQSQLKSEGQLGNIC